MAMSNIKITLPGNHEVSVTDQKTIKFILNCLYGSCPADRACVVSDSDSVVVVEK